jgi:hypothetical protein
MVDANLMSTHITFGLMEIHDPQHIGQSDDHGIMTMIERILQ